MEPTQQHESEGDIGQSVQQVLRVLRKGRWWILSSVLTTVLVAFLGLSILPNRYKAEATISVDEQQISKALVTPLSTQSVTQRLSAITQEILSRARLLEIIHEFALFAQDKTLPQDSTLPQDGLVELMRKAIEIEPIGEGRDGSLSAFKISFTSGTPEVAQAVTQKLCSLFIERNSATQVQRANATSNFLKEPLEAKRKRAADLERQIEGFKIQHASELADGRMSSDARLTEARMQLQNTISNLERTKQQGIIWESMLNGSLTRLKAERASLLVRFTPKHPEVLRKDEEIAQMESLLNNAKGGAADSGRLASADPAIAQLVGQIRANRLEVDTLTKDQKHWEAAVAELQGRANLAPVRDQQLADLVRQSETLNSEIESLEKLQQQTGMSAEMERNQQGQQFRQLDAASLPFAPSSPPRMKIALGSLGAGLALGFAIAFLLELRRPSFHTEQELRKRFAPPLVLSVPAVPTVQEKRSGMLRVGFELVAGSVVTAMVLAVEFYVYKHS